MTPEDRLDALLTARQRAERERRHDNADPTTGQHSLNGSADQVWEPAGDAELAPLLASAQRLASLRLAQLDPVALALEARMLARATERRRQEGETFTQARGEQRDEPRARRRFLPLGSAALRPALVAAALLLALGIGTLTTAAAAGPGSPLFGLHRLEQRLQAGIAGNNPDRAHQHLQFARQWLAALRDAAAQHRGDPNYSDALAALREEDTAAAQEIAQVSAGAQRAALEADLAALRADECTTLQAALLGIGWPDRIATTAALGALNAGRWQRRALARNPHWRRLRVGSSAAGGRATRRHRHGDERWTADSRAAIGRLRAGAGQPRCRQPRWDSRGDRQRPGAQSRSGHTYPGRAGGDTPAGRGGHGDTYLGRSRRASHPLPHRLERWGLGVPPRTPVVH